MKETNPKADRYFIDGCGRCSLAGTPECKVNNWQQEMSLLRSIVLDCGLTEELKWGVACYTFQKSNVLLVSAFKDFCAISFFKGALLKDTNGVLEKPGENSQATRRIPFTCVQEIINKESVVKAFISEAIEVEKAGLKIDFKEKTELLFPEELQKKLDEIPAFKKAFNALTPGRQRAYNLFFSAPKQSKTRESRIEKCLPRILEGKGLNER